jgi:protein-disulfide isomerase
MNNDTIQKLSTPVAIVVAGALIAAAVYFASISGNSVRGNLAAAGAGAAGAQVAVNIKDVKIAGEPFIGNPNAPVILAYWADYQCPFCKAVDVGGIPQIPITPAFPILIKNYVDTGKLKIVFKDFAFLGPDSITAALYGQAVWELYPNKYYEWREAMMVAQDEEHGGFGNEDSIISLSDSISGVSGAKLKALVAQKTEVYIKGIDADKAEGASFGIQGTPGFITGTKLIAGAADPSEFTAAIDAQLK